MANETISTDTDWVDLATSKAYNETVTINSGATLTIDRSTIDAQGIADSIAGVNLTCTSGQSSIQINNNSTTQVMKFYGPESGTLSVQNGCSLIVRGGYVVLQSSGSDWQSSGGANQSLPAASWTDLYEVGCEPSVVFVETGSGTNVWTPYVNVGSLSLANMGLGALGNWFSYNTSTGVISFGDGGALASGKGGNIPASGARVRVYNIGLGKVNSSGVPGIHATPGTNYEFNVTGGIIDVDGCYMFGFYSNIGTAASVSIINTGSVIQFNLSNIKRPAFCNVFKCVNRNIAGEDAFQTNYVSDASICDSIFVGNSPSNGCVYALRSSRFNFEDTQFFVLARTASTTNVISADVCKEAVFTDCTFVGGRTNITNSPDCTFLRPKHSDSPNSSAVGTNYREGFGFTPVASGGGVINGLTLIGDGASSAYSGSMINNCDTVKNCNYACNSANAIVSTFGMFAHDNNWGSPSSGFTAGANTNTSFTIQNQRTTSFGSIFTTNNVPSNSIIKACHCQRSSIPTALQGTVNTIFYEILDTDGSPDTGCIGLFFVRKSLTSTSYVTSGTVSFDNGGSIYLKSAGASITYEWPHKIIGVTSFLSSGGVTLGGSGTENFTIEASVDAGSGYGSWIDIVSNWSTLAAVSISANDGFKVKIRITHSTGSSSDYLNKLQIDTECDYETYKYPEDYVSIVIQNVKDGSRYWLYNVTNSSVVASGLQSGTSDITIQNVPYNGVDETLLIRVRKGGGGSGDYRPFETNAILTSSGSTVYVSQELDYITT